MCTHSVSSESRGKAVAASRWNKRKFGRTLLDALLLLCIFVLHAAVVSVFRTVPAKTRYRGVEIIFSQKTMKGHIVINVHFCKKQLKSLTMIAPKYVCS